MTRKTKADLQFRILELSNELTKLTERLVSEDISVIKGRIEAFEFSATQFEVYADDNDTLHRRYGTKGKERAIAAKRSQTFRDAAEELREYAAKQKVDLAEAEGE